MGESRALHFTIEGSFVTNAAREKLFVDKDLASALRLLRSATVCDELTSDEQLMLCLSILHGAASIVGNSGNGDYGVEYRDDIDEHPTELSAISQLVSDMAAEINMLKEQNRSLLEKTAFLGAHISEHLGQMGLERVNADYYNETGDPLFEDVPIRSWMKEENQLSGMDSMLDSFIQQRRREDKAMENDEEPVCDYGWLEPDGTFHPVEWGEHQIWAGDWLNEHMPYKENPDIYFHTDKDGNRHSIANGDVLIFSLNWILLDSPFQGLAKATRNSDREMTKAQKEFLYDYYIERGRNEEANALYED